MKLKGLGEVLLITALAVTSSCTGETQTAQNLGSQKAIAKGGDDRTGDYEAVENWWKPAPDHEGPWTWGQVSGVAVDTPDRIIVGVWGDRNAEERRRDELPGGG